MTLEKTRSRNRIIRPPKVHFSQKKRKPLNRKRKFQAHENIFKSYHVKRSAEEVRRYAEECRARRLANPTVSEEAFARIMERLPVDFEREKIFAYASGTRFVIFDFYIEQHKLAIEIDGSAHQKQLLYDQSRDLCLAKIGIRTIRIKNSEIKKDPQAVEAKIRRALNVDAR